MGIWGTLWLSRTVDQLESFKRTLTDEKEIEDVERTIAILKEKDASRNEK